MFLKTDNQMAGLGFIFPNCSPLMEGPKDRGKNHFLEHLMAKRLYNFRKEATAKCLSVKCVTTHTDVRFLLSGLDKYVRAASKPFYDSLFESYRLFVEFPFENEKDVIENEYNMAFSQPAGRSLSNALRKHFSYWAPIGDKNVVRWYKYKDALEDIKRLSKPVLSFAFGKEDFEVNCFNEPFKKILPRQSYEDSKDPLEFRRANSGPNANLVWLLKEEVLDDREAAAVKMLCTCLARSTTSPLFAEIRQKRGLAYHIGTGCLNFGGILPYFSISSNNPERCREVFEEIVINNAENIGKYIPREWFEAVQSSCAVSAEIAEIFPHKDIEEMLRMAMGYTATLVDHYDSISYEEMLETAVRLKRRGYFFYQE